MRRWSWNRRNAPIPAGALVLLLAPALTLGCGGQGDIAGRVTHRGKALVCGTVVLLGSDGMSRYGEIKPDGTYFAQGIAPGAVKIGVSSPNPRTPVAERKASALKGKGVEIKVTPRREQASAEATGWFPI